MTKPQLIRFLDYQMNLESLTLTCGGNSVAVEPQVFDLIRFFAENSGRVLSRDDLIESVWRGRIVSDAAISTRINAVRTALGDDGKSQRILKTVPRCGFRFLPESSFDQPAVTDGNIIAKGAKPGAISDHPSIVIMPFDCLADDPETQNLAQGLRIDIQNALIRLSGLSVIAVASANATSDLPVQEAATLLGARYFFQGQVRRAGAMVRFSAQLMDTLNGQIIWSDQLDRKIEDTFVFLDEITSEIVTAMSVQLIAGEQARLWHKALADPKSIEVFYRGINNFFRMTEESLKTARRDFENIARHNPDTSLGPTWVSLTHWFDLQRGWSVSPEQSHKLARKWAEKAVSFEDGDGQACTVLSHLYLLDRDFDAALKAGEFAVRNRPSCANANGFYANVLHYCGQQDVALKHIERAIRHSPYHPPFFKIVLASVLRARGDLAAAIPPVQELIKQNGEDVEALLLIAAIEAEQEATAMAVAHGEMIKTIIPEFSVENYLRRQPYRDETIPAELSRLLRVAGLPD